MDLDKLKVVDLRKELQQRGLDTKGNKAVLVKRLKDAMDKESNKGSGQAPVVTQASDGDGSHNEEEEQEEEEPEEKDSKKIIRKEEAKPVPKEVKKEEVKSPKKDVKSPRKDTKSEPKSPEKKPKDSKEESSEELKSVAKPETNGDQSEDATQLDEEDEDAEAEEKDEDKMDTEAAETRGEKRKRDDDEDVGEGEPRVEKRRREEKSSPEKPPAKKRERSPPKEDEPEIDFEKPQLSWYDSDLHLQVEKKNFLSAKPLNDGCMGYIWAGARATHGVSSGKVCFEVKITEELKWDDPSRFMQEQKERDNQGHRYKIDRRKDKDRSKKDTEKKGKSDKDKSGKSEKTENSDENTEKADKETDKSEESGEKMETEESKEETTTVEGENKEEEDKKNDEEEKSESKDEENKEVDSKADSTEEGKKEDGEKMETDQEKQKTEEKPKPEPIPTHYFRVGFSLLSTSLQLGESKHSFAYESTGNFITDTQFQDYGVKFGVGDVVGAYLSIDDENVIITYTVNGVLQPTAITVPRSEFPEENFALFPHVLCRNYAYEINFGAKEDPWFPHPEELSDYQFLQAVEEKVAGPKRPESRKECEIILMIGLPGSGKTTWVKNHLASITDKTYTIIGNNPIFERMTVDGEPLKSRFGGSWKMLVNKIQKCLNTLTDIAALRRRNFIIDQTNVFPNAQRRKLRAFEGFKRKAVCVVCEDEEHGRRQKEHESDYGKTVPESTMLDLKAQMELPQKCEWLEELVFTDLNEEEARKKLKEYTEEANKKGYFRRWHARQDDKRSHRNYRDRRGYGSRYDRYSQGSWSSRAGAGSWGRDRRDRGPPPRQDAWRQSSRGPRHLERDRPRDNRSGGGYGGSRSYGGGRNVDVWQSSQSGWGSGNSQGGWNAQMYGSHGYGAWGQQGWKFGGSQGSYGNSSSQGYGSQGSYGSQQSGYGGSQGGYGSSQGGYGQQNWNYYGQYSQQQGWGNGQKRK